METKPRVLAAIPPPALVFLERTLGSYVELLPAHTLEAAMQRVRADTAIALVVCGAYFDQSRVFDLLHWIRNERQALPIVCCRILPYERPEVSIEALRIVCDRLAAPFIDVPQLNGAGAAEAQFRSLVLSALGHR